MGIHERDGSFEARPTMKKISESEKKASFERMVNAYYAATSESDRRRMMAMIKAVKPEWKPIK